MIKVLKNSAAGFIISLMGSFPLGYLNLFGLHIYTANGLGSLFYFLAGVVSIEMLVVAATLKGAMWLLSQKKLVFIIELFSIAFLISFAAYLFLHHQEKPIVNATLASSLMVHPFVVGLTLSAINFFQVPFWAGWNVVMIESKRISTKKFLPYFYVAGTAAGTLTGMTAFVFGFEFIINNTTNAHDWINALLPITFIAIALFQLYKLFTKYNAFKTLKIKTTS